MLSKTQNMTQGAPTNREKQEITRKPTKCRHTETHFNWMQRKPGHARMVNSKQKRKLKVVHKCVSNSLRNIRKWIGTHVAPFYSI